MFTRCCGSPDDENLFDDASNELREQCFYGLESFASRCPKDVIAPFASSMLRLCVGFLRYDPNYCGGDEDVDMSEDAANSEEDYGYDDEDDYNDGMYIL